RDHFGANAARHIRHFFRTFVDQQDDEINFWMVLGDGVGDCFQQHGLTRLRLSDDHSALTLSDRCKQIQDTRRHIVRRRAEFKLLVREQWRQVLERDAVPDLFSGFAVNGLYLEQGKIFFAFLRRADKSLDRIAGLKTKEFYL